MQSTQGMHFCVGYNTRNGGERKYERKNYAHRLFTVHYCSHCLFTVHLLLTANRL